MASPGRVALAWLCVLVIICVGLAGFVAALIFAISSKGPERLIAALMLPFCLGLAKLAVMAKDKIAPP